MAEKSSSLNAFSSQLADLVETVSNSLVGVSRSGRGRRKRGAHGTGVAIAEDLVVTAAHIGHGADEVELRLPSGEARTGQVLGYDASTMLAVVRVEGSALTPAKWAEALPRTGELALTLSRTRGGVRSTFGMIASVSGAWKTMRGGSVDALIDMDATLARGGSGGPLLATDGRVLGINVYGLTRGGTTIPASTVQRVAEALQQPGGIKRGRLGVGIQRAKLSGSAAENAGQDAGILITDLESEGPADRAGLLVGDILISVDGETVGGIRELAAALSTRGGSKVQLGLLRGGEKREVEVELAVA